MDLADYLVGVATRIEDARTRGDRPEVIRLLRLLRDICIEKADELERDLARGAEGT